MARPTAIPLLVVVAMAAACGSASQQPAFRAPTTLPTRIAPSASPSSGAAEGFTFPVGGKGVSYQATHAGYAATDIFAACGAPVLAVTDGVILEVNHTDNFDPRHPSGSEKGGLFVSLLGDDGVRYYGSHLLRIEPGITAGVRVVTGQRLGLLGRTGNASGICHLHFGISPPCARVGDWWVRRGVVWPAPYLDAWRAGKQRSAAAEVKSWQDGHGCPASPPA